jgi:uncharacterized protein RhaS with RHS repeats
VGAGGLYYYRARFYDPASGRFISEDPLGFGGGTNFYTYAHDNPANDTDPLGLWSADAHAFLYQLALSGDCLDSDAVDQLSDESARFDETLSTQREKNAFMHGMRAPGQDPTEAEQMTDAFVDNMLTEAASAYPSGKWQRPFARAIHTLTDETSPAHRQQGVPLEWHYLDFPEHGDGAHSIEDIGSLTDDLMLQNINLIRGAYRKMTGKDCGCPN